MGVRFPIQQQRPDFGTMQQVNNVRQPGPQPQESQPTSQQAQEPAEEGAVRGAQEPQALPQQTTVERSANNAGAQTPGSIIDILA